MTAHLRVSLGQCSDAGAKPVNQDSHGACIPEDAELYSKGVAMALSDGISTSEVAHIASETAIRNFLGDYFCTSAAWSVKKSGHRVIQALNSWLHWQTDNSWARYDKDRGYVCTFTGLVIKSTTAHVFHVGDSRAYRLRGHSLEQLTEDHRHWAADGKSYLGRALGVQDGVGIDYHSFGVEAGDIFVLATDGVYEHVSADSMVKLVHQHASDLDAAAKSLVQVALEQGSTDNLTAQIMRVEAIPEHSASESYQRLTELRAPPDELHAHTLLDGYEIIRKLHASHRSHVYLARDTETDALVALKTPSTELQEDAPALERFMMEEWIARRVHSPHVVKPSARTRMQSSLYVAMEFVEGKTLKQWLIDNPKADLETVRGIVEQVAKGLRALHRQEMLHQDLRPENIMIDDTGTAKIVDFGAVAVMGLQESFGDLQAGEILGTVQYAAPEYFLGESGSSQSDLFSLAVVAYQMLTGHLPYGPDVAKSTTRAAQLRLKYQWACKHNREVPPWVDGALKKALQPDPQKRYQALSEFLFDLRHPNKAFISDVQPPLIERNPAAFWRGLAAIQAVLIALLAYSLNQLSGGG